MARQASSSSSQLLLSEALRDSRAGLIGVALISAIVNILYLTGSMYMMEVYDRVLPSQSVPTLIGLSVLALLLFVFQGLFDFFRNRILVRIGTALDERVNGRVFDLLSRLPLTVGAKAEAVQPIRALDSIRGFLSGPGPVAFCDLPWLPFYLFICFAFHPLIGLTAAVGAALLVVIAILTEVLSREGAKQVQTLGLKRQVFTDSVQRNAEVLGSMGMVGRIKGTWSVRNAELTANSQRMADVVNGLSGLSRVLRAIVQSAVLGVGAYLVIQQQASAGIIIAGSILASRALAPVEMAVGQWRGFVGARQGWARLREGFKLVPTVGVPLSLPPPRETLSVEGITVVPPGTTKQVVIDASFRLKAGDGLGIVGASASGKSSLARALAGVWVPPRGKIRLDGAALEQWSAEALGTHIGYLPQSVELMSGTVAQNIARFEDDALPGAVIAAAEAAGVHDMILRLPNGYETEIGSDGSSLSAGQRQRIALARALYGDPFLVILDEPNSNLDADGEGALTEALLGVRKRGGIAVVVAHRPSALAALDTVLMMQDGRAVAFGPRDEVIKRVTRPLGTNVEAFPTGLRGN